MVDITAIKFGHLWDIITGPLAPSGKTLLLWCFSA